MGIYNTICSATGVSGIKEDSKSEGSEDSSGSEAMMELTIQQKALKRIPLVMTVLTMMHLVTVGMMNPDILITATKTDIYDENGDFQYYE